MTLRIDDFKAALSGGGARANLFRATIFWPNADIRGFADFNINGEPLHSFMIKQANMPGRTINTLEVPFRGRMLKVSGDTTFEDWSITVTNDNNYAVRSAFERWQDAINGNATNQSGRGVDASVLDQYTANIEIDQLGRNGQTLNRYRLIGCWPTTVDPIEVSYDNGEIQEFGATLAYQWWESVSTDEPSTRNFVTPPNPSV